MSTGIFRKCENRLESRVVIGLCTLAPCMNLKPPPPAPAALRASRSVGHGFWVSNSRKTRRSSSERFRPDQAARHSIRPFCLQVGSVREALAALQQVQQGVGPPSTLIEALEPVVRRLGDGLGNAKGCRLSRPAGMETFPTGGRRKNAQALHLGEQSKTVEEGLQLFRRRCAAGGLS